MCRAVTGSRWAKQLHCVHAHVQSCLQNNVQFTIVHNNGSLLCCVHKNGSLLCCVHNRNPCLSCRHHIDPELPHHHTPRPNTATCHVNTLSLQNIAFCWYYQNLCSRNITFWQLLVDPNTLLMQLQWLMKVFLVVLKLMMRMMKETLEWWQMGKCGAEDDKSLLTAQLAFYCALNTAQLTQHNYHFTLHYTLQTVHSWHCTITI